MTKSTKQTVKRAGIAAGVTAGVGAAAITGYQHMNKDGEVEKAIKSGVNNAKGKLNEAGSILKDGADHTAKEVGKAFNHSQAEVANTIKHGADALSGKLNSLTESQYPRTFKLPIKQMILESNLLDIR